MQEGAKAFWRCCFFCQSLLSLHSWVGAVNLQDRQQLLGNAVTRRNTGYITASSSKPTMNWPIPSAKQLPHANSPKATVRMAAHLLHSCCRAPVQMTLHADLAPDSLPHAYTAT
eukprot:GHRQ01032176.1.p1 GENE.GHRQ01032176.1~~GHRQ01032176.1.p1  ORF type:complete len:114 (-),score=10.32 GHRQ01032176.1:334-675(-)